MAPTRMGEVQAAPYANVPHVDGVAEVDPFWQESRNASTRPPIHLSPAMPGHYSSRQRWVAAGLLGIFVSAAGIGVHLTYGPRALASQTRRSALPAEVP